MTRAAPSRGDAPAIPGPRRGRPAGRRALPRGPRRPSGSPGRAIVRAALGRLPEPRRKSPGRGGGGAEGGAAGCSPGLRGTLRPPRAPPRSGSCHLPAPPCSQVRAGNPDLPAPLLQQVPSVPKSDWPVPRGWTASLSFLTYPWLPCPLRPPRSFSPHPCSCLPFSALLLCPHSAPPSTCLERLGESLSRFIPLVDASLPYLSSPVALLCLSFVSVLPWSLARISRLLLDSCQNSLIPEGLLCSVLLSPVNGEIQLAWIKGVLQRAECQLK